MGLPVGPLLFVYLVYGRTSSLYSGEGQQVSAWRAGRENRERCCVTFGFELSLRTT
jgi:hypothetical protein